MRHGSSAIYCFRFSVFCRFSYGAFRFVVGFGKEKYQRTKQPSVSGELIGILRKIV